MKTLVKPGIIIALSLLAVVQALERLAPPAPLGSGLAPRLAGDTIPAVMVQALEPQNADLKPVLLESIGHKDCVLYYFFETSCDACETGANDWRGIKAVPGASVVWVNVAGPAKDAVAFLEKHGIVAPAFQVSEAEDGFAALGVEGTPSLWAVRNGVIRATRLGFRRTPPDSVSGALCSGGS